MLWSPLRASSTVWPPTRPFDTLAAVCVENAQPRRITMVITRLYSASSPGTRSTSVRVRTDLERQPELVPAKAQYAFPSSTLKQSKPQATCATGRHYLSLRGAPQTCPRLQHSSDVSARPVRGSSCLGRRPARGMDVLLPLWSQHGFGT